MQADVIPVCRELGIAVVCYSPLGRGFLTGQIKSYDDIPDVSWCQHMHGAKVRCAPTAASLIHSQMLVDL